MALMSGTLMHSTLLGSVGLPRSINATPEIIEADVIYPRLTVDAVIDGRVSEAKVAAFLPSFLGAGVVSAGVDQANLEAIDAAMNAEAMVILGVERIDCEAIEADANTAAIVAGLSMIRWRHRPITRSRFQWNWSRLL